MGFAGPHLSWLSANNGILAMSTTLNLVSEMERIASALGTEAEGAAGVSLSAVAEKIAKNLGVKHDEVAILAVSSCFTPRFLAIFSENLGVKHDEVAILAVSTRWRHLHFLVPEGGGGANA